MTTHNVVLNLLATRGTHFEDAAGRLVRPGVWGRASRTASPIWIRGEPDASVAYPQVSRILWPLIDERDAWFWDQEIAFEVDDDDA